MVHSTTLHIAKFLAVSILLLLLPVSTCAGSNDWFYRITPPGGAAAFDVGPYNSEFGCKDWLGSALFLHGPYCHDHPTGKNCVPIGNGFAYPKSYPCTAGSGVVCPNPAPDIPSGTCFESAAPGMHQGYYFFSYSDHPPAGTAIGPFDEQKCDNVLAKWTQGRPGSGCFYVGDTRE